LEWAVVSQTHHFDVIKGRFEEELRVAKEQLQHKVCADCAQTFYVSQLLLLKPFFFLFFGLAA